MGVTQRLGTIPLAIQTDSSNNVGIGANPISSTKFYVLGNTTNYGITSENPSGYGGLTLKQISGNSWSLGVTSNNLFFYDANGGATRMTLTGAGNVGIGTSSPWGKFNVVDGTNKSFVVQDAGIADTIELTNYSNGGGLRNIALTSATLIFNTGTAGGGTANERMRILSGGNVAIGMTGYSDTRLTVRGVDATSSNFALTVQNGSPANLFYIRNDGLFVSGTLSLSPYNFDPGGRVMYVNSLGQIGSTSSTRESKIHIKPITSVDYIMQLNPVSFYHRIQDTETRTYTDEYFDEIKYGFIADEVEKVNLDLVFYNENEDGTKKLAGVEYMSMIAVLTKAVQELSAKVTALENK